MAESDSVQRVDENGIKDAQPSDIVLDMKNEGTTKDVHIVNGSVHYTGEDLASNGEISQEKGAQQNGNGIGDHELTNGHQNGGAKSDALFGDEVIVKPAPAESAWTVEPDGAVELLLGTTESTSRTPITVVQGLQRAVRAAPNRTALAVKRNNEWVKWTYLEYYESVRAAAKSFIKVCECFSNACLLNLKHLSLLCIVRNLKMHKKCCLCRRSPLCFLIPFSPKGLIVVYIF